MRNHHRLHNELKEDFMNHGPVTDFLMSHDCVKTDFMKHCGPDKRRVHKKIIMAMTK